MKSIILFFFIGISSFVFAQNPVGYLVTEDNEKINFFKKTSDAVKEKYRHLIVDDVTLTGQFIIYFNEKGKQVEFPQAKAKEMRYSGLVFKNMPISKMAKRLHQIILENDQYVLTNYSFLVNYFYIFEKDSNKMVVKRTKHSKKRKNDYKSLDKILSKYFSDCPGLIEKLRENILKADYRIIYGSTAYIENKMFKGFHNYKCDE